MEKYFMAALTSVNRIGSKRLRQLIRHFGSARSAWSAEAVDLREAGLPDAAVQSLETMRARYPKLSEEIKIRCDAKGIKICSLDEDDYPTLLRSIDDAPMIFYYKGTLPTDDQLISMVGTREITNYGRQATLELAEDLASAGMTIVSGGANGIDTTAHLGALKNGRTIAVLGCGLEVIYPIENRRIFERISENGAVISEYPPKMPPTKGQFPRRNRIIAGLSKGTVVVEAGETSGALNTARHAINYARDLFAVPGSIHAKRSRGCNNLIRNGAILVRSAQDILTVYDLASNVETRKLEPLTEEEATLFALVPETRAAPIDEIIFRAEESGLDELTVPYAVNVMNSLQLKGYVMEDAAGSYLRTLNGVRAADEKISIVPLFSIEKKGAATSDSFSSKRKAATTFDLFSSEEKSSEPKKVLSAEEKGAAASALSLKAASDRILIEEKSSEPKKVLSAEEKGSAASELSLKAASDRVSIEEKSSEPKKVLSAEEKGAAASEHSLKAASDRVSIEEKSSEPKKVLSAEEKGAAASEHSLKAASALSLKASKPIIPSGLNDEEAAVFSVLSGRAVPVDTILLRLDEILEREISPRELSLILFGLEMKGLVTEDDAGNYIRTQGR